MGSLCERLEPEAIFGLAAIRPEEMVLDIGCGTGIYTIAAARRGAWVVALARHAPHRQTKAGE